MNKQTSENNHTQTQKPEKIAPSLSGLITFNSVGFKGWEKYTSMFFLFVSLLALVLVLVSVCFVLFFLLLVFFFCFVCFVCFSLFITVIFVFLFVILFIFSFFVYIFFFVFVFFFLFLFLILFINSEIGMKAWEMCSFSENKGKRYYILLFIFYVFPLVCFLFFNFFVLFSLLRVVESFLKKPKTFIQYNRQYLSRIYPKGKTSEREQNKRLKTNNSNTQFFFVV
jgi:hypothetical protein